MHCLRIFEILRKSTGNSFGFSAKTPWTQNGGQKRTGQTAAEVKTRHQIHVTNETRCPSRTYYTPPFTLTLSA